MKDFLLIANTNAITYKEFFPLLKEGKARTGYRPIGKDFFFSLKDDDKERIVKEKKEGSGWKIIDGEICGRVSNACWFTTLRTIDKRRLLLTKTYNPKLYPKYDNYDAINVNRVQDIPYDYNGIMGVPITFLDHYNPEQFEILSSSDFAIEDIPGWQGVSEYFYKLYYEQGNKGSIKVGWPLPYFVLDGKAIIPYKRILIRRKQL